MDEPGLVEQQMEPRIPVNETGVQRWGWMPLLWVQRKFDILIFETDRSVFKPRSKTSISSWWLNNSVGVWHWSSMPNLSSNFYHVLVIVQSSLTFVVGAWFPYCFLSCFFVKKQFLVSVSGDELQHQALTELMSYHDIDVLLWKRDRSVFNAKLALNSTQFHSTSTLHACFICFLTPN